MARKRQQVNGFYSLGNGFDLNNYLNKQTNPQSSKAPSSSLASGKRSKTSKTHPLELPLSLPVRDAMWLQGQWQGPHGSSLSHDKARAGFRFPMETGQGGCLAEIKECWPGYRQLITVSQSGDFLGTAEDTQKAEIEPRG